MKNEIKIESVTREIIYVYGKPVFSEEKANELEIKENILGLIENRKELEGSSARKESEYESDLELLDMGDYADWTDNPVEKIGLKAFSAIGKGFAKIYHKLNMATDDTIDRCNKKLIEIYENDIALGINNLEDEQIGWFPARYKELFSRSVNHNFSTAEDYQAYFDSLTPLCESLIQKMKIEMDNAHILSVEEMNSLREENKINFINVRNFSSGQILIKHPFMPNTYMGIETSEDTLFHIKMQCLSRIMQCLGATRVSGHAYVSENNQRQMDINGKISYKVVDADGSFSKSQNKKYESDYVLEDSFSGDFSEQSYEEAVNEAKRVGLYEDFDIKNILDQRNPEKQNEMKGRRVKIELTRELNESFDIAFSLQVAGFGMNGGYKEILDTRRKVMFELEIEF